MLGTPVTDRTELQGTFDFRLTWAEGEPTGEPDPLVQAPASPLPFPDDRKTAIVDALQDQLGLKLEAEETESDVFIVTHVERPEPN